MTEAEAVTQDSNVPSVPPHVARRRRREILQSHRAVAALALPDITFSSTDNEIPRKRPSAAIDTESLKPQSVHSSNTSEVCEAAMKTKRQKANTQKRYDPQVPMSKEEVKAWRAAARRVRNRESAAASRERTQNRITELEGEVETWKAKYYELLEQMQRPAQEAAQSQQPHEVKVTGAAHPVNGWASHECLSDVDIMPAPVSPEGFSGGSAGEGEEEWIDDITLDALTNSKYEEDTVM